MDNDGRTAWDGSVPIFIDDADVRALMRERVTPIARSLGLICERPALAFPLLSSIKAIANAVPILFPPGRGCG